MADMTLFGVFVGNIWRDEMNGKSIFRILTKHRLVLKDMYQNTQIKTNFITGKDEKWFDVKCSALETPVPSLEKGTPVKVTGYFLDRNQEVWDFIVSDFSCSCNDDVTAVNFLNELGISKDKSQKIVNDFGNEIFDYDENMTETLINDYDIKEEKATDVIGRLSRKTAECEVFKELSTVKIPYPYTIKAVKTYGKKALDVLKGDPYQGLKIGFTFKQCDNLAIKYGYSSCNTARLRAATDVCMSRIASEGHTYTPIDVFNKALVYQLEHGGYENKVSPTTTALIRNSRFKVESGPDYQIIIDRKIAAAEQRVAKNILKLCNSVPEPYDENYLPVIENKCGMEFGTEQRNAFEMFRKRGIKILTGGPGTGKTTTVKGLILCYQMMHPKHKIKLAAPTGRAAQRLAESTEMPATTVHKLLEFIPYGESPTVRDQNNPVDADFIVVDEVSMMDIQLFDMFLEAVKPNTTILLVGDIHQLESVGAGAVLRDLLKTKIDVVDATFLTEVFRQKGGSPIIDNSIKINQGRIDLEECNDFIISSKNSQKEMFDEVIAFYKAYRGGMFDIQILCPSYKGESGIDALNVAIRDMVNPTGKVLTYGYHKFREGDKIIMTRNNDEVGYYNGDIGIIETIPEDGIIINIRGKHITLTRECFDDIRLAYAITIHRSQGSEFKNVIVVLPKEPKSMLVRNLFYTGVTRAKKKVIIVSEQDAIKQAVETDKADVRRTRLSEILDKSRTQ